MSHTQPVNPEQQREALEDSQRKASEQTPKNFRDESTDDKRVEIGGDKTDHPIRGIDPQEGGQRER